MGKCLRDPDSPNLSTSPPNSPPSSGRRREPFSPVQRLSRSCGPTSRRRSSKTRQQAVLPPRQSHAANLRNGEGESFRYGQAPEGPPYSLSEITPFESMTSSQNLKLSMDFCGDSVIQDFAALF